MRCCVCGGEQSGVDRPIDHSSDCRIGRRRAFLAERDDPLGVGGVIAAGLGRPVKERKAGKVVQGGWDTA